MDLKLLAKPEDNGQNSRRSHTSRNLYCGDCWNVLRTSKPGSVDFIYIDPPYYTKREFLSQGRKESTRRMPLHFDDRWNGGHVEYLRFLALRVQLMHRVLRPEGVLLVHLDWHIVHYVKVMLDQIFGAHGLINELIWYYQTGGASRRHFSRKHDTILVYGRGDRHYFNAAVVAMPRSPKALHRARWPKGARISVNHTHKNPDDVIAIPALNPMAAERTGFPTQKPLALLELLISAFCPPQGVVGDYFCGSGTTLVAARRLGRAYTGCDISPAAMQLTRSRLRDV